MRECVEHDRVKRRERGPRPHGSGAERAVEQRVHVERGRSSDEHIKMVFLSHLSGADQTWAMLLLAQQFASVSAVAVLSFAQRPEGLCLVASCCCYCATTAAALCSRPLLYTLILNFFASSTSRCAARVRMCSGPRQIFMDAASFSSTATRSSLYF